MAALRGGRADSARAGGFPLSRFCPAWWRDAPSPEVGPYCFAAREIELRDGALWPADSTDTHEVTGDFLEEAVLPDSVQVLHSAAFYNCHRLRRVEAGPALESLGSDLFTNCKALRTFALRGRPRCRNRPEETAGCRQRRCGGGVPGCAGGEAVLPRIL